MSLTTEYNGVEIKYSERNNQWVFELKGREKSADSLADAKGVIDHTPKEQKKVTRFEAYLSPFMVGVIEISTVGACSKNYRGNAEFWITNSDGKRSKEPAERILKITPENDRLVVNANQLVKQIREFSHQWAALVASMERVDIPQE